MAASEFVEKAVDIWHNSRLMSFSKSEQSLIERANIIADYWKKNVCVNKVKWSVHILTVRFLVVLRFKSTRAVLFEHE